MVYSKVDIRRFDDWVSGEMVPVGAVELVQQLPMPNPLEGASMLLCVGEDGRRYARIDYGGIGSARSTRWLIEYA